MIKIKIPSLAFHIKQPKKCGNVFIRLRNWKSSIRAEQIPPWFLKLPGCHPKSHSNVKPGEKSSFVIMDSTLVWNSPLFWIEICLFIKLTCLSLSTLRSHIEYICSFPTWQLFRHQKIISSPPANLLFPRDGGLPDSPGIQRSAPGFPPIWLSPLDPLPSPKSSYSLDNCNTIALISCWTETLSKNSGNLLWLSLLSPQNPDPNLFTGTAQEHVQIILWLDIIPEMNHQFPSLLLLAALQANVWDRHHP